MPGAIRYTNDPDTQMGRAIEDAFTKEISTRQAAHKSSWKYYEGDHHRHLKADQSRTDDNVTVNMVELLIDKGVSALVGTNETGIVQGVQFDIVDQPGEPGFIRRAGRAIRRMASGEQPSPAQTWLDMVWRANKKNILLHHLTMTGGVTGHVFVKLVPAGIMDERTGEVVPRMICLDPDIVTVFWDASDMGRVLWYRLQYGSGDDQAREDIVRSANLDGAEYWTIYSYTSSRNSRRWELVGEPVVWEYPWPPIVDWQNLPRPRAYYGRADVSKTNARLNDSLNFTASNMQRILKHHASPSTIGTGFTADKVQKTAVDRLWTIPDKDAKVYNLEMQSELASSLSFMQFLRRAFFDAGREVDPAGVHDRLGDLTNFALRVLYGDTLAKNGTKRLLYGEGLVTLCRRILELGGFDPRVDIHVGWADPLPKDHLADASALDIDSKHGLSRQTYLERRGFEPEMEDQRVADEIASGQGLLADTFAQINSRGGFGF